MYVPLWLFIPAIAVLILAVHKACKLARQLDTWQNQAIEHQKEIIELSQERGNLREELHKAQHENG